MAAEPPPAMLEARSRTFLPPLDLSPIPTGWLDGAIPLEIDLGCGKGTFLVEMARRFPERRFIGVERQIERVRKTGRKAAGLAVPNAVIVRAECLRLLEALPDARVDHIHLLFPDPWPKRRHHPRRLVQRPFLEAACAILKPHGLLDLVTDHPDYAAWMRREVDRFGRFEKLPWPEDPERPQTDFERKFRAQGLPIHHLRLRKAPGA